MGYTLHSTAAYAPIQLINLCEQDIRFIVEWDLRSSGNRAIFIPGKVGPFFAFDYCIVPNMAKLLPRFIIVARKMLHPAGSDQIRKLLPSKNKHPY